MNSAEGRLSTGISGLDTMLQGGFLPGSSNLVAGSPGTGKTTLGLHFVAAGVAAGEKSVFVTFEYLPQQIYRDAARRGWPLKEWEDAGKLRLICTTPDVLLMETELGRTVLDEAIEELGADRLVLDSMTHFEFLGRPGPTLREDLAGLMNHLRLLDVTSVITHEIPEIMGPTVKVSEYGLEFMVDTVILLKYVELDGDLQKAINVLKFRGGDHDKSFRRLGLGANGMIIGESFKGIENIGGGSARKTIGDRGRELI